MIVSKDRDGNPESGELLKFAQFSAEDQAAMWAEANEYFEPESQAFRGVKVYPNWSALQLAKADHEIVAVEPTAEFGVTKTLSNRYTLAHISDARLSIPYLRPIAAEALGRIAHNTRLYAEQFGFFDALRTENFNDFQIAVTSMTRASIYQEKIASEGQFARRGSAGGEPSVHEMGLAFDIDHSGIYVQKEDGQQVPLNPNSPAEDLDRFYRLLPTIQTVINHAVGQEILAGTVMALREIPDGWGCWHVATLPVADNLQSN